MKIFVVRHRQFAEKMKKLWYSMRDSGKRNSYDFRI